MIQLIKVEKSYSNGLGAKVLAFVDNFYAGQIQPIYIETDEYQKFMSTYDQLSKQERMEANTPVRWKIDYYIVYPSYNSLSQQKCYSLEELELFFKQQLSVDSVSKQNEFLGNKVVPI